MVGFQVLDKQGNDYCKRRNGFIVDHGFRLISKRLHLVRPYNSPDPLQLNLF